MPEQFRFQFKSVHLTYKNHLPLQELLTFLINKFGEAEWYSLVTENGHDDGTQDYEHTHVAIKWKKKPDSRNPRVLDFNGIHPHIEGLRGRIHELNTWKYHEKEPVQSLRSELGPGGRIASATEQDIKNASTLYEACKAIGIDIKTVSDVQSIREDRPKRPKHVHRFREENFNLSLRRDAQVIVLSGPTGTGKTEWALTNFDSPFLCSHIDDLRDFDAERYDGIVFDDMSFAHMPREGAIHLLDWDQDRSIHCRYHNAFIPKETRKIFTTNKYWEEIFPKDESGAIRRRITEVINVRGTIIKAQENHNDLQELLQWIQGWEEDFL